MYVRPHNIFLIDQRSSGKVRFTVLIFHQTLTDAMLVLRGEILFVPCWSFCRLESESRLVENVLERVLSQSLVLTEGLFAPAFS